MFAIRPTIPAEHLNICTDSEPPKLNSDTGTARNKPDEGRPNRRAANAVRITFAPATNLCQRFLTKASLVEIL